MERSQIKQWIIVREDLNMSPGKLAAQAAHASTMVFLGKLEETQICRGEPEMRDGYLFEVSEDEKEWLTGSHTKIVLKVKNESQLLKAYNTAKLLGLPCSLIKDAGFTELQGQNYTTVAVGPCHQDKAQPVVKRLRTL